MRRLTGSRLSRETVNDVDWGFCGTRTAALTSAPAGIVGDDRSTHSRLINLGECALPPMSPIDTARSGTCRGRWRRALAFLHFHRCLDRGFLPPAVSRPCPPPVSCAALCSPVDLRCWSVHMTPTRGAVRIWVCVHSTRLEATVARAGSRRSVADAGPGPAPHLHWHRRLPIAACRAIGQPHGTTQQQSGGHLSGGSR